MIHSPPPVRSLLSPDHLSFSGLPPATKSEMVVYPQDSGRYPDKNEEMGYRRGTLGMRGSIETINLTPNG